jgi:hypothetical protein
MRPRTSTSSGGTFDAGIRHSLEPTLSAAGFPSSSVGCSSTRQGYDLRVCISLPGTVEDGLRRALAVRVLDAVAACGERFGDVDVEVFGDPR